MNSGMIEMLKRTERCRSEGKESRALRIWDLRDWAGIRARRVLVRIERVEAHLRIVEGGTEVREDADEGVAPETRSRATTNLTVRRRTWRTVGLMRDVHGRGTL